MTITDEMLAAYAEGKTSGSERDAIRQYLVDNPSELQSVMMMMDVDFDLDTNEDLLEDELAFKSNCNSHFDIALSSAAFAPVEMIKSEIINNSEKDARPKHRKGFGFLLNNLLDEITN